MPSATIVIAAHKDGDHIGATVETKFRLSYPTGRLEIVAVSDGSTDRTDEIFGSFRVRGV